MRHFHRRRTAVVTTMLLAGLAFAGRVEADGVVFIDSCQTLSTPNTVYRLTTNLTSGCFGCLVVAADKITIDMQGHSLTSQGCPAGDTGIGQNASHDAITVKNGTIQGYTEGIALGTRASVLGVNVFNSGDIGIRLGAQGLVKSCELSGNFVGIDLGPRGQVQQNNVHNNFHGIIARGDNDLVTMNTVTANIDGIILQNGDKSTVSYNTVSGNNTGISTFDGVGYLITRNVALNNSSIDYSIDCPSDVTFNESTLGFPTSYDLNGTGCKTPGND